MQSCVFFFPAIHQRLESDGTERVEGSMTQRLENILNSKHVFLLLPNADYTLKVGFCGLAFISIVNW